MSLLAQLSSLSVVQKYMRSWKRPQMATLYSVLCHERSVFTSNATICKLLQLHWTWLSWLIIRSWPAVFGTQSSSLFSSCRFTTEPIHSSHISSYILPFTLDTYLLSIYLYSNWNFFINEYVTLHALLSSSHRLCTPWLAFEFHDLWLLFTFKASSTGNVKIIRSSIVCNGSNKKNTGHLNSFHTLVRSSEASANPSRRIYARPNREALFLAKSCSNTVPGLLFMKATKFWNL